MGSRSHAMLQACYSRRPIDRLHAAHMCPCAGWAVRRVARAVTMVAEAWHGILSLGTWVYFRFETFFFSAGCGGPLYCAADGACLDMVIAFRSEHACGARVQNEIKLCDGAMREGRSWKHAALHRASHGREEAEIGDATREGRTARTKREASIFTFIYFK